MKDSLIESELYRRAAELITRRYPTGWGGAAAVYTAQGSYLTSVAIETFNASCELCIEVGAMCEATKLNERITHCLCLVRDDEHSPFKVLSPCGICQERLRFWGADVRVAVTTDDGSLKFVSLHEMQPYHWSHAYPPDELEHYTGD